MSLPKNIFEKHNHRKCRVAGMADARSYCHLHGLRFTKVRARVLEILLQSHKALGAYEVLEQLRKDGLGSQPPVVYRALEFLTAHHFVHRIESLNAFTACANTCGDHESMFLICQDCVTVAEAPMGVLAEQVDRSAGIVGFQVQSRTVEVFGRCPACLAGDGK